MGFKSDIEIAQEAVASDIRKIAEKMGLTEDDLELYGKYKAKLDYNLLKKPGGDREMVDILALVLQHDEQAVLSAVDMALKSGVPTKTHVLNLLHRLVDGKSFTPPTIDAPQALTLTNEPKANVERYDALRKTEARHAS